MKRQVVRLVCLVCVLSALLLNVTAVDAPQINAKGAILIETTTGETLFEWNARDTLYPASTTKIMTAIIAIENGNVDDMVTVSSSAVDAIQGTGSVEYLKRGERLSFMDLLRFLMITSSNDSAIALAEHTAGSVDSFVVLMNAKADELGCVNTNFTNPHGLHDENHYTCARDLAIIAEYAMKNPIIAELAATTQMTVEPNNVRTASATYTTTNRLLYKGADPRYYYPEAIGIKTGTTTPAGLCLVSGTVKDDLQYISVVLGAERGENEEYGNFAETIKLLNYARDNFARQLMVRDTDPVTQVEVRLAKERDKLTLVPEAGVTALLPVDFDRANVEVSYVCDEDIVAPIEKGQPLGTMEIFYEGRSYGTLALVAADAVARSQVLYIIDRIGAFLGGTAFKIIFGVFVAIIVILIARSIMIHRRRRAKKKGVRAVPYRGTRKK